MGKKSLVFMGFLSLTLGWFFPLIPIIFFVMLMYHIYNNYIAPATASSGGYYYPQPGVATGGGLGGLGSSLLGGLFGGSGGGGNVAYDSAPPPYGYNQPYGYGKAGMPPAASSSGAGGSNFWTGIASGAAAGYMLGRRPAAQQPAPYVNPNAANYTSGGGPNPYDTKETTHTSTSYAATKRR